MVTPRFTTFSELHRNIAHLLEITTYLDASLSHLEVKLRGFAGADDGQLPAVVRESVCKDLHHQAGISLFLYESLHSISEGLCRADREPDIVGSDVAQQNIHNGEKGGDV